jgi:septum formation protein
MGSIYEKPRDKEEQLKNLKHYRDCGQPQHVLTGVVVIVDGVLDSYVEETSIYFDETVEDTFLEAYVETEEGLGVAAGYRVQLRGALMMKKIDGDYFNCVGLPFNGTFKFLQKNVM